MWDLFLDALQVFSGLSKEDKGWREDEGSRCLFMGVDGGMKWVSAWLTDSFNDWECIHAMPNMFGQFIWTACLGNEEQYHFVVQLRKTIQLQNVNILTTKKNSRVLKLVTVHFLLNPMNFEKDLWGWISLST